MKQIDKTKDKQKHGKQRGKKDAVQLAVVLKEQLLPFRSFWRGTAMMLAPFSFWSMTPLHTVYPLRPISRLNRVARSVTRMFLLRTTVLKISSEK